MKSDIVAVSTTEERNNPSSGTMGQCSLVDFVTRCHFTVSFKIEFALIPHMPVTVLWLGEKKKKRVREVI